MAASWLIRSQNFEFLVAMLYLHPSVSVLGWVGSWGCCSVVHGACPYYVGNPHAEDDRAGCFTLIVL